MNIFLPQSIQTVIELEEIADVRRQIINPKSSNTSVGINQDCLLGSYNITDDSVVIDWKNTMNIMSYVDLPHYDGIVKNKKYSGKELFSRIIPNKINIKKGNIEIVNGIIKSGKLNASMLGDGKSDSIHHNIWDKYGMNETQLFLDNVQRLVNNFNFLNGMSIGIKDLEMPKDVIEQINNFITTTDVKSYYKLTEVENNPKYMTEDVLENTLYSWYNVVRDEVSKLVNNNMNDTNSIKIMSESGSKGGITNSGQIIGCVGMQAFENSLQPKRINNRTSPFFFQNDDRSDSRGLLKNSMTSGVNITEFINLMISGRTGVIDSAVKTAESGYIQRKMIKSSEDIIICYDSTARSANNSIVQFIYGDTGANVIKQFDNYINLINMNNDEILGKYSLDGKKNSYYHKMIEMRNLLRNSQVKYSMSSKFINNKFKLPINLKRIVQSTRNTPDPSGKKLTDEKYILDKLDEVLDNKNTTLLTYGKVHSIKKKDEAIAKTSLKIALHEMLAPARCINEYKLTKTQFDNIIDEICDNYNKNLVEPGEMVGPISAQSMGEPTTQMTLKSFHTSGIGSISQVTQGVPRLKELLSLSKKIKTPQMAICLTNEYMESKEMAKKIGSHIEHVMLGQMISNITCIYDPYVSADNALMIQDNISNKPYHKHNPKKNSCQSKIDNLPWVLRVELDKEKMFDKEVTLLEIKSKFCIEWEKQYTDKNVKKDKKEIIEKISQIALLSNTNNDKIPILHIRFEMNDYSIYLINNFITIVIENLKLKGIPNISSISADEKELINIFDEKTGDIITKKQHVIYTKGINLYDIRYFNCIDLYKTTCNDIIQTYEIFGIEAARAILLKELTVAYGNSGQYVSYHNLSLMVDYMTRDGFLISIDRNGVSKSDTDTLARASFEMPLDHFMSAAFFSENVKIQGVSSRIMTGRVIKGGTGVVDLMLDIDMIEKSEYIEKNVIGSAVGKLDIIDNLVDDDIFMPE